MKLRYLAVAVCAVLVLALAPAALGAGGAAGEGYGGAAGNAQNEVSQAAAGNESSLPFTGLDLALLVVGGVSLLVVGAGLRRATKRGT